MNTGTLPDALQLMLKMDCRVRNGIQIGHGANCGITAPCGGKRAGFDGLFIRKSRLSEMYMHITKARKNCVFGGIENRQVRGQ
jgi:hypothetical protein